jgi:hypothetical protein
MPSLLRLGLQSCLNIRYSSHNFLIMSFVSNACHMTALTLTKIVLWKKKGLLCNFPLFKISSSHFVLINSHCMYKWSFPVTSHEDLTCGLNVGLLSLIYDIRQNGTADWSAPSACRALRTRKILGTNFCYRLGGPQCFWMQTERTGHLNIFKDPTRNRSRNHPPRGAVPQPTAPVAFSLYVRHLIWSSKLIWSKRRASKSHKRPLCGKFRIFVC